jgi:hypothetical protein
MPPGQTYLGLADAVRFVINASGRANFGLQSVLLKVCGFFLVEVVIEEGSMDQRDSLRLQSRRLPQVPT